MTFLLITVEDVEATEVVAVVLVASLVVLGPVDVVVKTWIVLGIAVDEEEDGNNEVDCDS